MATPLAEHVYDLRHACVPTWFSADVPATPVAEWAGHSVEVLLRIYAKCIAGQDGTAERLRVVEGGAVPVGPLTTDPREYQAECVAAFVASWRARGFSPVTIDNDTGLSERAVKALGPVS
ncbi:hypothetical protein [Streptosporangium roseum]|uniref:hypothetical protein n=1 Tax=Streptosporangium roseum TaxID=2001 RepID=UPI0004CD2E9B|nr:hypothetical protein [Streptosporangium roseum]